MDQTRPEGCHAKYNRSAMENARQLQGKALRRREKSRPRRNNGEVSVEKFSVVNDRSSRNRTRRASGFPSRPPEAGGDECSVPCVDRRGLLEEGAQDVVA